MKTKQERINFDQPISLSEKEDPFLLMRIIFVDFGLHKITKIFTIFSCCYRIFTVFCEIIFMVSNPTTDLVVRYTTGILIEIYAIAATVAQTIFEKLIRSLRNDVFVKSWSQRNVDYKGQQEIKRKSTKLNLCIYALFVFLVVFLIVWQPMFGDYSEFFLFHLAFHTYFGKWSSALIWTYNLTRPFIIYSVIRPTFGILYAVLYFRTQIFLINRYISHISNDLDINNGGEIIYQQRIHSRLRMCIIQHLKIRSVISLVIEFTRKVMPVFVVLGAVCSVATLFYTVAVGQESSNIMKLRLTFELILNIIIVVTSCEAGQMFINESGRVFDVLMTCRWYEWNKTNRKTLLIFMSNCLKPCAFTIAGIVLDYKLAVAVFRTACSYSLVLYQLKNGA